MGDLDLDTRVVKSSTGYAATLSRDWEIWGPNGGYVASIALRAAGAASRFRRPASFSAHRLAPEQEWLLCVAEAPIAHAGLIGGKAAVWTEDGRMLASGGGHMLCRPVPVSAPGAT